MRAPLSVVVLIIVRVRGIGHYLFSRLFNAYLSQSLFRKIQPHVGTHIPYLLFGSSTIAYVGDRIGSHPVVNVGVPGLATSHVLRHISLISHLSVGTAVVYVGVNDMHVGLPAHITAANLHLLLSVLPATNILYIPILRSTYQFHHGDARLQHIELIDSLLGRSILGTDHIRVMPFATDARDFGPDTLHLNARGNARLRNFIADAVFTPHPVTR